MSEREADMHYARMRTKTVVFLYSPGKMVIPLELKLMIHYHTQTMEMGLYYLNRSANLAYHKIGPKTPTIHIFL